MTPYPAPSPHGPPPPVRRSTTGAKVLTFSGAAVLLLAIAAGVFAVLTFVKVLPTGVLTAAGEPGPDVLAVGDVPGRVEVDLDVGTSTLWIVSGAEDTYVALEDVWIEGPGQTGMRSPAVDGSTTRGDRHGESLADVTVETPGTYTVSVLPEQPTQDVQFFVTPGTGFGTFFAGVGMTVLAWFVAIGGGILGVGLLAGGIVWWVLARRHNARMSATRHGADT